MTAFAVAESSINGLVISTEMRSYNSRHLDVALRLPSRYLALEEKIKALIAHQAVRGRIEVKIQIETDLEETDAFEIDSGRAKGYIAALKQLKEIFKIKDDMSLSLLLSAGGILKPVETVKDLEAIWPSVENCVQKALDDLDSMRKREGDFIAQDLFARLDLINQCIDRIQKESSDLVALYQQRLKERISLLTQDIVELDAARIAQEAAIIADKSDISEEIVRATSHLQQFRHIMNSDEPAGRKLNFLLQELHREFNTMGAKVGNADISHLIIEAKAELEKIREQIQNIE
jgi:uncharacterized protein (TIGR00255 family)